MEKPRAHSAIAGLSCGRSEPSGGVWKGAVDHDHPQPPPQRKSQPVSYSLPFLPHSPLELQAQVVPRDAGAKQLSYLTGTALHGNSTLVLPPAAVRRPRRQGHACPALHGLVKGSPGADTLSGLRARPKKVLPSAMVWLN
ncbi:hypothetical protein HJG60_009829 [Phyllostomus discolor]|uniref:Uncharacterized protein n=1 Tax=Phyllostomus discolor TaxID=89673 RepID=A0A834EPY8_9CHIR|nr:hypothetical protein HJG60_009829 [Phyllostomus discolor]